MTTENTPTAGDTPRVIDALIALPIDRAEAVIWETTARRLGLGPRDLIHLSSLTGLSYQLRRNGAADAADIVEVMIRRLAEPLGLTPIERQDGDPQPVTFTREGEEQTNDTVSADT